MSVSPSIAHRAEALRRAGPRPKGLPSPIAAAVAEFGPALKLYHRHGAQTFHLPRGVVITAIEGGLVGHLDVTVLVGSHRFFLYITPGGMTTTAALIDQPAWQDAVDALHAAEGC